MPRAPKQIKVDVETLRAIVDAVRDRPLTEQEHAILEGMLETTLWLERELQKGRLNAKRLYRMLFGPRSEKTAAIFPSTAEGEGDVAASCGPSDGDENGEGDNDDGDGDNSDGDNNEGDNRDGDNNEGDNNEGGKSDGGKKGHGRRPASDYRGAEKVCVEHESLKPGERCPVCQRGKLYTYRPRVVVLVRGGAPLAATQYELQRLRCNLCGERFTARPPPEAEGPKYDETAAAMIALLRYGSGLPHNRLGKLQASLGIPLPPSTQWDVVSKVAPALVPAHDELLRQAACGKLIHNDDTKMVVLAITGKRRAKEAPPDDPDDRTGMFTTGIVSETDGRLISLFITGRRHAGENLTELLRRRDAMLGPPLHMCDGLERNLPSEFATVVSNCIAHAGREFIDVHGELSERVSAHSERARGGLPQ